MDAAVRQRIRPQEPEEIENLRESPSYAGTFTEMWKYHETYPETRTFNNVVLAMASGFPSLSSVADMSCGSSYIADPR